VLIPRLTSVVDLAAVTNAGCLAGPISSIASRFQVVAQLQTEFSRGTGAAACKEIVRGKEH
jgi:hypothetical protein